MIKSNGYVSLITKDTWLLKKRFFSLRKFLLSNTLINNIIKLDNGLMIDFSTSIVIYRKSYNPTFNNYKGSYCSISKEGEKNVYILNQNHFNNIPEKIIVFSIKEKLLNIWIKSPKLNDICTIREGLATGNNYYYLKEWFEVNINEINFNLYTIDEIFKINTKFVPHNKGGKYRKWYGNNEKIIKLNKNTYQFLNSSGNKLPSKSFYFKEGLTWSSLSSKKFSLRYSNKGFTFDAKGPMIFVKQKRNLNILLSFLNSKIIDYLLSNISDDLDFNPGVLKILPFFIPNKENLIKKIINLTQKNIDISKEEWDDFETSWDFKKHPLLRFKDSTEKIENAYYNWKKYAEERFYKLKRNEEELNRIFINIYDLSDELTPDLDDKDITISRADRLRDIKSFISYAIGCIFGRYSPDKKGLIFAGGKFNMDDYPKYKPDEDGILPILDGDYDFKDDIVSKFIGFVEYAFGKEYLKENIEFIAKTLNEKSTDPKETLRKYFIKDFYKDHTKIYKKKPIYWMFTSGKKGAFKALVYLHRYDENTISRIRTDYLFKVQNIYESYFKTISKYLENPDELSRSDKRNYEKLHKKLSGYIDEIKEYDIKIQHYADQKIKIDLDNGVEENYKIFADILEKIK